MIVPPILMPQTSKVFRIACDLCIYTYLCIYKCLKYLVEMFILFELLNTQAAVSF